MESYEQLLDRAYSQIKVVGQGGERFELPKVEGSVSGNTTIITNLLPITNYIRRPVEQFVKFLQKELATPGRVDHGRLILNAKLSSDKVNEKVTMYVKEFVLCPVCGKPDTEIASEKGVKLKHCLACGAKSPLKYHI